MDKQTKSTTANAGYAPSPWRVDKPAYGVILDGNGNDLALICRDDNENETRQTARLIAAAPDLLNALRSILAVSELGKYEGKDLRAIAIAQGEAQNAIEKAIGV